MVKLGHSVSVVLTGLAFQYLLRASSPCHFRKTSKTLLPLASTILSLTATVTGIRHKYLLSS